MPTLHWCSVADVTVRVQADPAQTDGGGGMVWFNAPFDPGAAAQGNMTFYIHHGPTQPGLYYWRSYDASAWPGAPTWWAGVPGNAIGPGTLIQSMGPAALDVTLRFKLFATADGAGMYGECYSVGGVGLVDQWNMRATTPTYRPINVGDMIGTLYFDIGGSVASATGLESARIGVASGTVWQRTQQSVWNAMLGDYENGIWQVVTEHSPVREAGDGYGGTPQVAVSVSRLWSDWVPYVSGGGDPAAYLRGGDLFGDGVVPQGVTYGYQLLADGEGSLYLATGAEADRLQEMWIRFDRYATAQAACLALTHHPVSNALLVTDAGLVSGGGVGHHKVQRGPSGYEWSERFALAGSDDAEAANIIATAGRLDLVAGIGGETTLRPMASIDGGWGTPVTLDSGQAEPGGIGVEGRHYVVTVSGQRVWLWALQQDGSFAQVGDEVGVYEAFGSPRYPALAWHPTRYWLFVATWHGTRTVLNMSPDRGASWHAHDLPGEVWAQAVDDLQYPSLYCDRNYLWLAGYEATATGGATGRVRVHKFHAQGDLASAGDPVTAGACDEGRPAIFRRPFTMELLVLAPKTGAAWDDFPSETGAGIAEYQSVDSGASWTTRALHTV